MFKQFTLVLALLVALLIPACNEPPPPGAGTENILCVKTTGTLTEGISTQDIATFDWSNDSLCYGTIGQALSQLQSGEHLYIDDGEYAERISVRSNLAGSPGDYTTIRARNPGQVTLTWQGYGTIFLRETSYVEIVGFHILDPGELAIYVKGSSHHWMIRKTGWNGKTALTTADSHHGLFEECYAYGGPHRYPFQTSKGAEKIIFRRCLVRWDFSNTGGPQACFANYNCKDIHFQNCISIDGTDNKAQDPVYDGLKSFFTPNGSPAPGTFYTGCVSLNMDGAGGWWLEGSAGTNSLRDCIAWDHRLNANDATDGYKARTFASTAGYGGTHLDHCTFGVSNMDGAIMFDNYNPESMYNSIIYGHAVGTAVIRNLDERDYNLYYANNQNSDRALGPNSVTDVDPLENGLTYLFRPEPGSFLATAGKDSTYMGADITYRTGKTRTVYGEEGWNEHTTHRTFPFDHEDIMMSHLRSFYKAPDEAYPGSPEMIGDRGCAASNPKSTLTAYIVKYLGN